MRLDWTTMKEPAGPPVRRRDTAMDHWLTMRSVFFVIIAVMLIGCTTTAEPIDRLVTHLQSYKWGNGGFPNLDLPQTASTQEVVSKVLKVTSINQGRVTSYNILKIRHVRIRGGLPNLYTAVLVKTNFGEKIVLFKYQSEAAGWWSRVYDAMPPPEIAPQPALSTP